MENLNESCFAYPALRRFPINTKESTLESFGAYGMQKQAFSDAQRALIEANFNKAASYYDITLENAEEQPAGREILMFKGASKGVNMNEITSRAELEQAIDFILDKRASVPRNELAEAAKYVYWSASNTGIDMTTDRFRKIAHIAGIGVGDREAIENEFKKRATLNEFDRAGHEEFWKFAKELEGMSDDDFYAEANLNRVCDTIDGIDFMFNNQHKHAHELGYPEDVVFGDTIDDLAKQAADLMYVPSIDTTLSKTALLERKDAVNAFFTAHFGGDAPETDEKLLSKVASLDRTTATALLDTIDG